MENTNDPQVKTPAPNEIPDLTDTLFEETATLEMCVPGTNKPAGWVWTLAGPSHPQSVAYSKEEERKAAHRENLMEQARVNGRKWKGDERSDADKRREFIEGLVARIVTWNPVKIGGKVWDFSATNAIELLLKPEMGGYISQYVDYLTSQKAFMKASAIK